MLWVALWIEQQHGHQDVIPVQSFRHTVTQDSKCMQCLGQVTAMRHVLYNVDVRVKAAKIRNARTMR